MGFIKLADHHSCPLPYNRPDGRKVKEGDEWQCEEIITDAQNLSHRCGKIYKFTWDQRERGGYWTKIA